MTKTNKKKNLDLYLILIIITVCAAITAVLLWTRPFEIKTFDKIDSVTVEEYKTINKNKEEYLVLVYNSNNQLDERLEECVIEYAEYARTHKDAKDIYVIDYKENKSIINSSNFNISTLNLETSVPCIGTISQSGTITDKKTTISDICNLLEDYMQGKK